MKHLIKKINKIWHQYEKIEELLTYFSFDEKSQTLTVLKPIKIKFDYNIDISSQKNIYMSSNFNNIDPNFNTPYSVYINTNFITEG